MSYLVLHIDAEFIVGTVCADNGTLYPITNGKEELLWLYFFNNPHQNSISFGKDNKSHFNNLEVNYYGKFFEKIEKEMETFSLRGIEHPVIDLLKESGLLETLRKTYQLKTLDNAECISTLITFSTSIGDNAKLKTVEYFKNQGFKIDSYTIPLAELTCYHSLNQKALKAGNGSIAIFLEATNSTLHLMKLTLTDNYYLIDGKHSSWRGKGIDPRKRALARFVVNEVNKSTGVLSSEDEKEDECERLEMYADEWLKRLDVQTRNMPLRIPSVSFAKAPNMKKDVMVRKDDLDSDTGQYTQDLKDIFDAFRSDNIRGDVTAVFLLGDCFQSERVKGSFEQMIGKDKLYLYANKDIRDILGFYPKIDVTRYASEESRIKERAKAEELKQAEQHALDDKQRKEAEIEAQRLVEAQKAEQNRKEAQKLFGRAVQLEKEGKLEDARINGENALSLDSNNKEFKQFVSDLVAKINILNDKNELYKSYLSRADKFLENNELEKALDEYEAAQSVFDNAEITQKVIEVKRFIKNSEQTKAKIAQFFSEVQSLINQNDFLKAKEKTDEILSIDKANSDAKSLLSKIEQLSQQQEKEKQEKENWKQCEQLVLVANNLFKEENWTEAKQQYENATNLCPQEKHIKDKIKQCADRIKAKEDAFNELLFEATVAEKKCNLKQTLANLESAAKIKPDDDEIKKKIKNIKFSLDFETSGSTNSIPKNALKSDDVFLPKKKIKSDNDEDDFLSTKHNQKNNEDDSFIKKPMENTNDDDDFLGLKSNKKMAK